MQTITVFLFVAAATASVISVDNTHIAVATKYLAPKKEKSGQEVANDYLPPVQEAAIQSAEETVKAVEAETEVLEDSAPLAEDGYKYKTVRRLKYRQRRDVSEIANEYLPPVEEAATEATEVADVIVKTAEEETEIPQNSAVLGDDGYQYKTVHRLKYRQRRDVSEIANEYLPPVEEAATEATEVADVIVKTAEEETEIPQNSAVLGDDGYQYKTVRRLKYKHRRDVSEIPNEYLPPVEEAATEATEVADVIVKTAEEETEIPQNAAVLGDDGYQYKTVHRLKYRQRRDVSEIANEYLPPVEEAVTEATEVADVIVKTAEEETEIPQNSALLGNDGYQYKIVRRLKYRQRRDVSEIANEYLPPVEEAATEATEAADVIVKAAEEETEIPKNSAVLGDDGYQYKTVRRLKYRQRRDVSEIANEYLPPVEEAATEATEVDDVIVKAAEEETEIPQSSAVLGDDGYQYNTVHRLKYRQRRDVSEIANEYLPPVEEAATKATEVDDVVKAAEEETEIPQSSAVLGDDGYQYKTVRRLKYRQRRDVSGIANEYLPPVEETATEATEVADVIVKAAEEETEIPQSSAVLGDDGYQYKTVRRLKYRQRRDVSEIANEYLPPVEEAATKATEVDDVIVKAAEEETEIPQNSAVLGDDGYQYKTVRRLKYRQRRDVSEIANEYLPPDEEAATEATEVADVIVKAAEEETEIPQNSAVLGDDGYKYKTVRRLKYRQRRDISEIANDYLPPVEEEATIEYLPPVEEAANDAADVIIQKAEKKTEDPQESAFLADDGYQYKTVRRLKYKQRRDVSEIATPAVLDVPVPHSNLAPEETATLSRSGYHYRTVKRTRL